MNREEPRVIKHLYRRDETESLCRAEQYDGPVVPVCSDCLAQHAALSRVPAFGAYNASNMTIVNCSFTKWHV